MIAVLDSDNYSINEQVTILNRLVALADDYDGVSANKYRAHLHEALRCLQQIAAETPPAETEIPDVTVTDDGHVDVAEQTAPISDAAVAEQAAPISDTATDILARVGALETEMVSIWRSLQSLAAAMALREPDPTARDDGGAS